MLRPVALSIVAVTALFLAAPSAPARADAVAPPYVVPTPVRTISLSASAHVTYLPDVADLTLGVRSEAPTAAAAASQTNAIGAKILAGILALGVSKEDVSTTQYDVEFVPAQPPVVVPGNPSANRPAQPLRYVVTTSLTARVPVAKAGDAIDAAVRAGANQSYGLSFATTKRDELYATALTAAVKDAHARAAAIAAAAGVTLGPLQSVTNGNAPSADAYAAPAAPMAMAKFARAPIVSGKQAIDASVDVVYAIQ